MSAEVETVTDSDVASEDPVGDVLDNTKKVGAPLGATPESVMPPVSFDISFNIGPAQ